MISSVLRRTLALVVAVFAAAPGVTAAPLSLDEAIRLALQKNQALKVSEYSPQIARANVLAAYGAYDPVLNFERSYSEGEGAVTVRPLVTSLAKTDDYSLSVDGLLPTGGSYSLIGTARNGRGSSNAFTDKYETFAGVRVTQPLLRGLGYGSPALANLRIAKADRSISDAQHRQNVIDTVTGVILAYNSLSLARENLRISRLSRQLTAQLVEQNEKRNRVGAMSDAEVTQARARLATREENILFNERSAADAENILRQLIGESVYPLEGGNLEIETLPPAAPLTVDLATDLKTAFAQRPDYQSARLSVTRRQASSALAQSQLMPRLDFVGSYGYAGLDKDFSTSRQMVRDRDLRSYSVGMVVSVPLTFAEGRGRARAAKLGLRQSEADLVRIEQDIAIDVTSAAGQIQTTRQRVVATRAAFELAKQALDSEEKKFSAGTSRTLDVLQLQEQLAQVEGSQVRALTDQRRAVANYERELGVTLQRHNITLEGVKP